MNCRQFQNDLHEYLDGALSAADQLAAQRHLGECGDCRAALQREQRMAVALSAKLAERAEMVGLDAMAERRMAAAIKATVGGERVRAPFWIRFAWSMAAAGALAVVMILAAQYWAGKQPTKADMVREDIMVERSPAAVDVSYSVPTYEFRKDGDRVMDALTVDEHNVALLAKY